MSLRPKNPLHAAAVALGAGLLSLTLSATASSAAPVTASSAAPVIADSHPHAPRPTVVLVHGAWADGSSWSGVTQRLHQKGYTVDVVPNPLRGVASDAAYLRDYLSTIKGPIVLAGHSYGGMVITQAATGNPNVKALVYVDAYIPQTGDAVAPLSGPDSALAADPTTVFDFVGHEDGTVDLYIKQALFPSIFAQRGVSTRKAETLASGQRPLTLAALSEKTTGAPAWKTIPSWDVLGTADRVIPPAQQEFMAQRAHARITKVRAPHLSMVSNPRVVTDVIVSAAKHS